MLQKVICIDDDPIGLMMLKLIISKSNFAAKILSFNNGEEALDYFSLSETSLNNNVNENLIVFLDLNMPIMDGWEFLENFEKDFYSKYQNVKIILLSSSIDPKEIEKAKNFPMVLDFMSKPLSKDILKLINEKLK